MNEDKIFDILPDGTVLYESEIDAMYEEDDIDIVIPVVPIPTI